MSDGVTVMASVLLGLLYVAFYLGVRHEEVRAAWDRRGEGEWSWKLLIPRAERPWMAWGTFVVFGLLAVEQFFQGVLWLAAPSAALCLIGLAQGIWAGSPRDA
jgi:hypothetical protein